MNNFKSAAIYHAVKDLTSYTIRTDHIVSYYLTPSELMIYNSLSLNNIITSVMKKDENQDSDEEPG